MTSTPGKKPSAKAAMASLFFGGLLPVIAFTLIEDKYGPLWGTVAGMAFGLGEITYEKIRFKSVAKMTWVGNLMILLLGILSIASQDGIWFKLQPAIFEAFFAIFLWGSLLMKKSFLIMMAEKQGNQIPDSAKPFFNGITFRVGLFFAIQAALATWAAISWSTAAWAMLKGVGVTVSFLVYMALEILWLRARMLRLQASQKKGGEGSPPCSF